MRVVSLVENTSKGEFKAKHGLSLYIEAVGHKMLFDLGPDDTLFENAQRAGIDLTSVDTVIISHGHYDHGGALDKFLDLNTKAEIYIQEQAFEKHYAKALFKKLNVGIEPSLKEHPQITLLKGDYRIDKGLLLFTVYGESILRSTANDTLYSAQGRDDFSHEQNLIVFGERTVLIMGCGHKGVATIMKAAEQHQPDICIGGFHLFNPMTKKTVSTQLLDELSEVLRQYDTHYYTCHCTGEKASEYLMGKLSNISYFSCGEELKIG